MEVQTCTYQREARDQIFVNVLMLFTFLKYFNSSSIVVMDKVGVWISRIKMIHNSVPWVSYDSRTRHELFACYLVIVVVVVVFGSVCACVSAGAYVYVGT